MKKIIFILPLLSLFSCGGGGKSESAIADSLKAAMPQQLQGAWVMDDYIAKLDSTLSPRASWETMEGAVAMLMDKHTVNGDSMLGGMNWNNHEGYPFTIYFKMGSEKGTVATSLDMAMLDNKKGIVDLGAGMKDDKPQLTLYQYDSNGHLAAKRTFSRILDRQMDSDVSAGIDHLLNKKFLCGDYSVVDAAGKKINANFLEDGKTKGFDTYKYFHIASDFNDAFMN